MIVIIDTNIIFSTLLNSNSAVGNLLFNSDRCFEFYSCSYMRFEIDKHWEKIKKISKLSDEQLQISKQQVFSKLKFIDEAIIPESVWLKSEKTVRNIDPDDIAFVALTTFLKGTLWTGDKVLYKGLTESKFRKVINTQELLEKRERKSKKK